MPERLSDQLKRLASEATPGPWHIEGNSILSDSPDDPYVIEEVAEIASDARLPTDEDAALIVLLVNNRDNIAALIDAAEEFRIIALNGTVCTPPDTWADPFLGGDGSGKMFDVEALKCSECRPAWRNLLSALAAFGAGQGTDG